MYLVNIIVYFFILKLGQALEAVPAGELPIPLSDVSAVYDGIDTVFIFGSNTFESNQTVYKYSLESEIVEIFTVFPVPLHFGASGTDGKDGIYYIGGFQGNGSGIWKFTRKNPTPILKIMLPYKLIYHSVGEDGAGSIYIVGGIRLENSKPRKEILRYNALNNSLEVAASFSYPTFLTASAWNKNSLWTFGGFANFFPTTDATEFQPEEKLVRTIDEKLNSSIPYAAAVPINENIYIIGGSADNGNTLTKFSTITETFESIEVLNFPIPLLKTGAVYVQKTNRIYLFGGSHESKSLTNIWHVQL